MDIALSLSEVLPISLAIIPHFLNFVPFPSKIIMIVIIINKIIISDKGVQINAGDFL